MKKIRIAIIILLILFMLAGVGIWILSQKGFSEQEENTGKLIIDEMIVIDEEMGEYMITGIPKDYAFVIKNVDGTRPNKGDFLLRDAENNKVKAERKIRKDRVIVEAPKGGYEKDQIYSLDVGDKGVFADERLKSVKKLYFCVSKEVPTDIENNDKMQGSPKEKLDEKNVALDEQAYDIAFVEKHILGKTLEEIEAEWGPVSRLEHRDEKKGEYEDYYGAKTWYRLEDANLNFFFYPKATNAPEECKGAAGSAYQMLQIGKNYDVVSLCQEKDLKSDTNEYLEYTDQLRADDWGGGSNGAWWYFGDIYDYRFDTAKYNMCYFGMSANGYRFQLLANGEIIDENSMCGIEYDYQWPYWMGNSEG